MIQGILDFLTGLRLLLVKAPLRSVLWRMLGLLLLLMLLLMGSVFGAAEWLATIWLPEGDAWYWQALAWLVHVLAFVLAMLLAVVSFTVIASIAAAPWLDSLVVVTAALRGLSLEENTDGWGKQSMQVLMNTIRPLLGLLLLGGLALLLMLIPVVGQLAATLIWTMATVMFLNFELMDTNASRKGLNFKQRRQLLKRRRFYWLGFGGMATLLMLVPFVNILVLPAAVVALSQKDDWAF